MTKSVFEKVLRLLCAHGAQRTHRPVQNLMRLKYGTHCGRKSDFSAVQKCRMSQCTSGGVLDHGGDWEDSDVDETLLGTDSRKLRAFSQHLVGHSVLIIQPKIAWGPHKPRHTTVDLMLQESKALVETLPGWRVVDSNLVNVKFDVDHAHVFGSGNLDRLTANIRALPAVTAVFVNVDILSPLQQSCLFKEWRVPVYDRYQIVLSIFKAHAKSKLARLHIAMAEIPYVAARLRELTLGSIPDTLNFLDHVGGHGFKLLEERSDMFKKRGVALKKSLEKVRKFRAQDHEKLKKRFPIVAVIGYTNAGKTSLVNCLTKSLRRKEDESLKPEDRLFATLDAALYSGKLPTSGLTAYFADTVGFIADIPATLVTSFEATLDCIRHASLILHIRDINHPDTIMQKNTVDETLQRLNLPSMLSGHVIEICNKMDKVHDTSILPMESEHLFNISCVTGHGIERLQIEIDRIVRLVDNYVTVPLKVPNGGEEFRFLEEHAGISNYDETGDDDLLITATMRDFELKTFLKRFGNLLCMPKCHGEAGAVVVEPNVHIKVQAFGDRLDIVKAVLFTKNQDSCEPYEAISSEEDFSVDQTHTVVFNVTLPQDHATYYVCLSFAKSINVARFKSNRSLIVFRSRQWVHQGVLPYSTLKTRHHVKAYYMPMWIQIIVILMLLVLSGLFSGLNLGLMSLEKTELKILLKVGDPKEKAYANKIYPIRKSGNYLLCTLLLGNVVVNSSISILFDDLTSGLIALFVASIGIVIFGEIVPQAICTRYGLAVGAYTVYITRFFMFFTFPLSYPISKLLDKILGEEVTRQAYNRARLLELIRLSKDQEGDLKNCQEVQIVTGALELSRKVVRDVMTNIKDVYMMPSDAVLDPKAVSEIVKSGYTRIPVYDPSTPQKNIVFILNVKDLALLDPEDKIPLMTICQFYQHPVRFVMEDSPLNVMLEEFKKGHYHLAIVQRINAEGDGDPTYEAIGLVTLEDIIEEIIQSEIRDEFDVIRDSRIKRMRRKETLAALGSGIGGVTKDLAIFFNTEIDACDVSPQLTLATFQYLSTNLDAFKRNLINENVLLRLIRQNVLTAKPAEAYENTKFLFQKGRETDHFVLILEGKCLITIGESNMLFEAGPFHYFGYEILAKISENFPRSSSVFSSLNIRSTPDQPFTTSAANFDLAGPPLPSAGSASSVFKFVPDFTLKVTQEIVYFKVSAATYIKAQRATLIEQGLAFGGQSHNVDYYKNRRFKNSQGTHYLHPSNPDCNPSGATNLGDCPEIGASMPNMASPYPSKDDGRPIFFEEDEIDSLGGVKFDPYDSKTGREKYPRNSDICRDIQRDQMDRGLLRLPRSTTIRSMDDDQVTERKRSLPVYCYVNGCNGPERETSAEPSCLSDKNCNDCANGRNFAVASSSLTPEIRLVNSAAEKIDKIDGESIDRVSSRILENYATKSDDKTSHQEIDKKLNGLVAHGSAENLSSIDIATSLP